MERHHALLSNITSLKAESPEHPSKLAGQRLANMIARERFLFEDDRLDSLPDEEHRRRRTTRSAADY
jgi:hypothetical protein